MTQRAAVTFPRSNNSKDEADTGMTPVATGKKHLPWWLNLVAGARSTHHDYFQLIMTVSCWPRSSNTKDSTSWPFIRNTCSPNSEEPNGCTPTDQGSKSSKKRKSDKTQEPSPAPALLEAVNLRQLHCKVAHTSSAKSSPSTETRQPSKLPKPPEASSMALCQNVMGESGQAYSADDNRRERRDEGPQPANGIRLFDGDSKTSKKLCKIPANPCNGVWRRLFR